MKSHSDKTSTAIRMRLDKFANITVTNIGWMRFLETVRRLADRAAFPEKGKAKEHMDRLKNFLRNSALLMDPEPPVGQRELDGIRLAYDEELGKVH